MRGLDQQRTELVRRLAKRTLPRAVRSRGRALADRVGLLSHAPGDVGQAFHYPYIELLAASPTAYPHYLWGTACAAGLAAGLGVERITAIEFGVAGGNGLVALEAIAQEVADVSGVCIDVVGFDTGVGLPKPQDHRDLPQLWREGDFDMDVAALRARLTSAELILGPVRDTAPAFLARTPAPIGFISFDLDLYSSTVDAFQIFEAEPLAMLPRVHCYFDDIIAFSHGDFSGERLAITEHNAGGGPRKLSPIYGLRYVLDIDRWWVHQMYLLHAFDHPRYAEHDGSNALTALPLR